MPAAGFGAKAFRFLSRSGLAIYSRLPIFGTLQGVVGLIRDKDKFLVIERNDGRGVAFPGGFQMPWESAEHAAVREVLEETGLAVTKAVFKLRYFSSCEVPVNISVFEMEAKGELRSSWEGTPFWLPAGELRERLVPSQKRIVEEASVWNVQSHR